MRSAKSAVKNSLIKLCKRLGETSPILLDFSSLGDGKAASLLLDTMRTARYLEPKTVTAPKGKKVLVIAPHPDDEVIGMGGVMAQMLANECDIEVISLTFGEDQAAVEEAKKAAEFMGYRFSHFFGFSTKNITLDSETLNKFAELAMQANPDVLFIPFMLDDHDDHRRSSEMLLAAHEKGMLSGMEKTEVWAYQVYTTLPLNAVVNITDVMDKKLEAIEQYQSRFTQRHWSHFAKGLSAFNVRFLNGNKKQDYAEVFLKISLSNYLKICSTYFRNSAGPCYTTESYNERP